MIGHAIFQSTPPSRVATFLRFIDILGYIVFQSTPPSRVATRRRETPPLTEFPFQSTPPSRVATSPFAWARVFQFRISIHTTLAGGDRSRMLNLDRDRNFNPHHPRGWRPRFELPHSNAAGYFNPHHPRGWRPYFPSGMRGNNQNFNPHHPRGWRLTQYIVDMPIKNFNPHHPRGWRPLTGQRQIQCQPFQSTPPSRVATAPILSAEEMEILFQSTPPSRVATAPNPLIFNVGVISIHTTLAGGDTSPTIVQEGGSISIHTTLAGGDCRQIHNSLPDILFQSTPPSRVATEEGVIFSHPPTDFNPHHPRGWRRLTDDEAEEAECISIHTTLAGGDTRVKAAREDQNIFQSTPPSRVATPP